MAFSFIHTADWQIGKPFGNVDGDPGAELRFQRIKTVERVAELARDRQVDAVLVAGDAFDSNAVSDRTIKRTLEALAPFQRTWVFLPGNHDAAIVHSVWSRMRKMGTPPNVIIADEPKPLDLGEGRATVLPAPLRRRRESTDLTEWFDKAPTAEGSCRIGLAHGSVANRLPDRGDAANEISDLRATSAGLCYLALGDWHGYLKIAERTYYAGAPEPDRHKANQSGRVACVRIPSPGAPEEADAIAVGHYSWMRLEVELLGTCDKAIDAFRELGSNPRACVVDLVFKGTISLAERHRLDRLLKELDSLVHYLEVDTSLLRDDPTPEDIVRLDMGGFVRTAADRLVAMAADPTNPQRANEARMALRMMYFDHLAHAGHGEG